MTIKKLTEIVIEIADNNSNVSENSRIISDLGLCSFDVMVLLSRIEHEVHHPIDATVMTRDMTVKQLYDLISYSEG